MSSFTIEEIKVVADFFYSQHIENRFVEKWEYVPPRQVVTGDGDEIAGPAIGSALDADVTECLRCWKKLPTKDFYRFPDGLVSKSCPTCMSEDHQYR